MLPAVLVSAHNAGAGKSPGCVRHTGARTKPGDAQGELPLGAPFPSFPRAAEKGPPEADHTANFLRFYKLFSSKFPFHLQRINGLIISRGFFLLSAFFLPFFPGRARKNGLPPETGRKLLAGCVLPAEKAANHVASVRRIFGDVRQSALPRRSRTSEKPRT